MQDPQLGRFMQIDPLAELAHHKSPYTHVSNNPIRLIASTGMTDQDATNETSTGSDDQSLQEVTVTAERQLTPEEQAVLNGADDYGPPDDRGDRSKDSKNNDNYNKSNSGLHSIPDRNPKQDKKQTPGDINKLKEHGWDHGAKGTNGGPTDLWKDKDGNVYQKPKDGTGYGEPIGVNLNDLEKAAVTGTAGAIIIDMLEALIFVLPN